MTEDVVFLPCCTADAGYGVCVGLCMLGGAGVEHCPEGDTQVKSLLYCIYGLKLRIYIKVFVYTM